MIGMFKRAALAAPETSALGTLTLALRMPVAAPVPSGCIGVAFDKGGATRRMAGGSRIDLNEHERAFCFHPGPYSIELTPFAQAPELGLHLTFAVDSPDPRVAQQRFDLYLASEAGDSVPVAALAGAIEAALQRELAQGNLELPPCTSQDEWNQFRSGFNELLYQRFGVTVDDCVPVDLGARVDYAQLLLERALAPPAESDQPASSSMLAPGACPVPAPSDERAMRRLFLELPCVGSALRLVALPQGQSLFRQRQALLQRLDQVSLSVATMPALALAAPGQALGASGQAARARHSVAALEALDEAWALLARFALTPAQQLDAWFDEADRIVANLEHHSAGRRALPESEAR